MRAKFHYADHWVETWMVFIVELDCTTIFGVSIDLNSLKYIFIHLILRLIYK